MIYAGINFNTQSGTTTITYKKTQEVIAIPYSDKNDIIEKGREPTVITSTITTFSEDEKDSILALLHSTQTANLQVGLLLFKQVKSSVTFTVSNRTSDFEDFWLIGASFTALDPLPYSAETGVALYA